MILSQPEHCIRIGRKSEVTGFDVWHCGQAIVGKFVNNTWGEDCGFFASPVRGEIIAVAHQMNTIVPLEVRT